MVDPIKMAALLDEYCQENCIRVLDASRATRLGDTVTDGVWEVCCGYAIDVTGMTYYDAATKVCLVLDADPLVVAFAGTLVNSNEFVFGYTRDGWG